MKYLFTIIVFITGLSLCAQSEESSALLEFFGGRYRSILTNSPGLHSTGCTSIISSQHGDTLYLLFGHEKGDQFQVMAIVGSHIIMQELFYMDGQKVDTVACCGNWFETSFTLRSFVKYAFGFDPDQTRFCRRHTRCKNTQTAFAPERGFFLE
jgi:hypothetical protein